MKTILIALSLVFSPVLLVHAQKESRVPKVYAKEKGGGDLSGLGPKETIDVILEGLESKKFQIEAASGLSRLVKLKEIPAPEHNQLVKLIGRGLDAEVSGLHFDYQEECKVDGRLVTFSTTKGQRYSAVCVNVPLLHKQSLDTNTLHFDASELHDKLLGLLVHEGARHFDVEDTTPNFQHPLAQYFAKTYVNVQGQNWLSDRLTARTETVKTDGSSVYLQELVDQLEFKIETKEDSRGKCDNLRFQLTVKRYNWDPDSRTSSVQVNGPTFFAKHYSQYDPFQTPYKQDHTEVILQVKDESKRRLKYCEGKIIIKVRGNNSESLTEFATLGLLPAVKGGDEFVSNRILIYIDPFAK